MGILLLLRCFLARFFSKSLPTGPDRPGCNKVPERLLLNCGSGDEPLRQHSELPRHALPVSSDARL
ncbi:hypothetical protein FP026_00865 [Rhizobium tropici]|uniref:Uncharacterized protein n=1 Tax=Rhizobium tropici TaxID=398 RepID=A0A5B0WFY6_RHITR|nr:hypothetical protein FP026_00865 [Rhizobium tropici]